MASFGWNHLPLARLCHSPGTIARVIVDRDIARNQNYNRWRHVCVLQ
jgi:hypothetical protein